MHNNNPNNNYSIYGFCIKNIKYCPAILQVKCSSYVLISCKTNVGIHNELLQQFNFRSWVGCLSSSCRIYCCCCYSAPATWCVRSPIAHRTEWKQPCWSWGCQILPPFSWRETSALYRAADDLCCDWASGNVIILVDDVIMMSLILAPPKIGCVLAILSVTLVEVTSR